MSEIGIRRATRADAEALAPLHAAALPSSLLTALGEEALVRYYAFAAESFDEQAWVAHIHGRIVGGCVLSHAPHKILVRFARFDGVSLVRELARLLVRDRTLRRRLLGRGSTSEVYAPELVQIFTAAEMRGQRVGAALLTACEAQLRTRGSRRYYVHTHRDDNEAGIRFYRREGFVETGESRSFGQVFLVMQKELV